MVAEKNDDREGIALTELARLFREEDNNEQAAHYYTETLKHQVRSPLPSPPRARIFLRARPPMPRTRPGTACHIARIPLNRR